MNDGPSTSFEASGRMSGNPRLAPAETVLEEDHGQTQTQPPIQQLRRGPEPNVTKNKGRKSTKGNSIERSKLSAKHIEEAAGDVSDLAASLLLACLFCHFSDCLLLLPGTCSLGLRCLGSSSLPNDCLPSFPELCCCCCCSSCDNIDCGFLDVCQHTAECLELAMEVSELCYH
ncbi:myoD family inhibitor domain-containing protein 2-like isoform X1 [Pelobates fuscus]|uniref:myoD family inhibitor domain-containing protein 2-like isoform X1 n=1 Tax=Pelobates fuscus TaxID=191477 RepID=UPI002FE44EFF